MAATISGDVRSRKLGASNRAGPLGSSRCGSNRDPRHVAARAVWETVDRRNDPAGPRRARSRCLNPSRYATGQWGTRAKRFVPGRNRPPTAARRAPLCSRHSSPIPDPVVVVDARRARRVRQPARRSRIRFRHGRARRPTPKSARTRKPPRPRLARLWPRSCGATGRRRQGIEASARCKDGALRALSLEVGLLEVDGAALALCLLRDVAPARSQSMDAVVEASLKQAQRIAKLGSWTWD